MTCETQAVGQDEDVSKLEEALSSDGWLQDAGVQTALASLKRRLAVPYDVARAWSTVNAHIRGRPGENLAHVLLALDELQHAAARVPGLEADNAALKEGVQTLRDTRRTLSDELARAESERDAATEQARALDEALERARAERRQFEEAAADHARGLQSERDAARQEVADLRFQAEGSGKAADKALADRDALTARVAELESSLTYVKGERAKAEADLARYKTTADSLNAMWEKAEARATAAEAALRKGGHCSSGQCGVCWRCTGAKPTPAPGHTCCSHEAQGQPCDASDQMHRCSEARDCPCDPDNGPPNLTDGGRDDEDGTGGGEGGTGGADAAERAGGTDGVGGCDEANRDGSRHRKTGWVRDGGTRGRTGIRGSTRGGDAPDGTPGEGAPHASGSGTGGVGGRPEDASALNTPAPGLREALAMVATYTLGDPTQAAGVLAGFKEMARAALAAYDAPEPSVTHAALAAVVEGVAPEEAPLPSQWVKGVQRWDDFRAGAREVLRRVTGGQVPSKAACADCVATTKDAAAWKEKAAKWDAAVGNLDLAAERIEQPTCPPREVLVWMLGLPLPTGPGGGETKCGASSHMNCPCTWDPPETCEAPTQRALIPTPTPKTPPLAAECCEGGAATAECATCPRRPTALAQPEPAAPEVVWEQDGVRVLADGTLFWNGDGALREWDVALSLARALAEATRDAKEWQERCDHKPCAQRAEEWGRKRHEAHQKEMAEAVSKAAEFMRERAAETSDGGPLRVRGVLMTPRERILALPLLPGEGPSHG